VSRRALEARLGQVAKGLVRAGGFTFPAGPVEGWPEAELRRLGCMVEAGGALRQAAWARLTDADLGWAMGFWLGEPEAAEAVGDNIAPGSVRVVERGPDLWTLSFASRAARRVTNASASTSLSAPPCRLLPPCNDAPMRMAFRARSSAWSGGRRSGRELGIYQGCGTPC
jgi:hypothetical protein